MNNLNLFLDYIRRIWLYIFKPYIAKRKLKTLPANEKNSLYRWLKNDTQSFEGSSFDSIARSLENKGIIRETYSGSNDRSSYLIEHTVWRYLKKNEKIILKLLNYTPENEPQKKPPVRFHPPKSWRKL